MSKVQLNFIAVALKTKKGKLTECRNSKTVENNPSYGKWHLINQSKTINLELWASWKIFDYYFHRKQNECYWRNRNSIWRESYYADTPKKKGLSKNFTAWRSFCFVPIEGHFNFIRCHLTLYGLLMVPWITHGINGMIFKVDI